MQERTEDGEMPPTNEEIGTPLDGVALEQSLRQQQSFEKDVELVERGELPDDREEYEDVGMGTEIISNKVLSEAQSRGNHLFNLCSYLGVRFMVTL